METIFLFFPKHGFSLVHTISPQQNRIDCHCHRIGHSNIRIDRFPYGAGGARTNNQRTGDRQVQRWLQSILAWMLAQLLLHTIWTAIPEVIISAGFSYRRPKAKQKIPSIHYNALISWRSPLIPV